MSDSQLHDGFSSALAKLERLVDVWGDLTATQANEIGVGYLVIQGVKALTSPHMTTPYSITFEALERLAAFRERITHLDIQDECLEGNVEALVVAMIKHSAASQQVRRDYSLLSDVVLWEEHAIEAVEGWLMMRNILVASFGAGGTVVEQLDVVIEDRPLYCLGGWPRDDANISLKRLELCGKLKAVPNIAAWIDEDIIWTIGQLRSRECHADYVDYDACSMQAL